MAITMARKGYKVGILDADITGPSIPRYWHQGKSICWRNRYVSGKPKVVLTLCLLTFPLENDTDPVLWRGPILGNVVKQFYSDVIWKDIDYLFVDMPPEQVT